MDAACRIEMLGGLRVEQAGRSISRFRTYKTGVLLAYLAFYPNRPHPRETLTELLWPDCEPEAGRNSLSKSLGSLRNQLEPPGVPSGAVVIADRASVRLNPLTCTTDVADFQKALRSVKNDSGDLTARLVQLVDLYGGELLPGFYEDWNIVERTHLAEAYLEALHRLIALLRETGDLRRAREYARRAVSADPMREETHEELIRLCLEDGDTAGALRQYHEWERLSRKEFDAAPTLAIQALVKPLLSPSHVSVIDRTTAPAETLSVTPPPSLFLSSPGSVLTGTVTLMLVQGETPHLSTRLETVIRRHGGVLVERPDAPALAAAFARATEAAACAVAIHSRQAERDAPLRIALQTGEVAEEGADPEASRRSLDRLREEGEWTLRAAHPGQILCGEAMAVLLRRDPEPAQQVADLGLFRLSGGQSADRLFDVHYTGRAASVPATPNAEPAFKNTLPLPLTRFIGRGAERTYLGQCLDQSRLGQGERLWTLTGPGGMGKTRLSLEIARQAMAAFGGAVWFVPLAEITEPQLIYEAIADAMGLFRASSLDPLRQVAQALADRPAMLVLDNFEQLIGASSPDLEAVDRIASLLEQAPTLTCLITSRQRLGIGGEREFPLSPLPTPVGLALPDVLAQCESVQLFVDRAQSVRPDFQITPGNAAAVATLCERLEGLPLAIELAAARAQVLTPGQMLGQLERRFDFLVSRQRNFVLRHRTIRAAIDWSYGLLTPELRRFTGLLSIFRGGWTLAAAEAVTNEPLALDSLAQIVECSLVVADNDGPLGEMRYRQLETLRQYAEETMTPADLSALHASHSQFFLHLAEAAEPQLLGPEQSAWLTRLEADHDNFRAALHWCRTEPGQVETGLRMAAALWRFWHMRGYFSEGRERLGDLLSAAGAEVSEPIIGRAELAAGILARYQNDYEVAGRLLWQGLDRCRDDARSQGLALFHLGQIEGAQNHWEKARALLEESLALCRAVGNVAGIAAALGGLGIVASEGGDFASSRRLFEEALAHRRQIGDVGGIAILLSNLGNVALLRGDGDRARALFEESLSLRRDLSDKWGLAALLNSLGLQHINQSDYPTARPFLEESLAIFREIGDRQGTAVTLCNLGTVALMTGDASARHLLSESLALRWKIGDKVGVAVALEALARMETLRGDPERAVLLWGVTDALREAIQAPLPPANRSTLDQTVSAARAALSSDAFAAAWAHGRGLELEQALALVLDEDEA